MKKLFTAMGIALIGVAFATTAFAQASVTASATATIVAPISIAKNVDMNFGNVATNGAVGTVTLPPTGLRSSSGGVTLPNNTGPVAAASFTVGGSGNYTYAITLPGAIVISSGTNTVDTFTSSPENTGQLLGGTQTLNVGATLHLVVDQAAGTYTNSAFTVTVNYN